MPNPPEFWTAFDGLIKSTMPGLNRAMRPLHQNSVDYWLTLPGPTDRHRRAGPGQGAEAGWRG